MPLPEATKKKAAKRTNEKDLNTLLREVASTIKDKSSIDMISKSIDQLTGALKEIDFNPQDSQALIEVLNQMRKSTDNSDLIMVLDQIGEANKQLNTQFQSINANLTDLSTYMRESKDAEWDFEVFRDANYDIAKIKAKRLK